MKVFNFITLFISLIIVIFILFNTKNKLKNTFSFNDKTYKIILFIILCLTCLLYFYKLGTIPSGMNVDEAGTIYDAINLSRHGHDRYLIDYPVYFWNYGGGQNALMTYIEMTWLKLLPFNPVGLSNLCLSLFILRIPAVLINLIGYFCFYKIIRFKFSVNESLLGIIIALVLPFSVMHSRWILESYLLFPMIIISSYFLLLAYNKKNKMLYFFSGLFFGLSLYTYAISYIIITLSLVTLGSYLIIKRKISFIDIIVFTVPLLFLGLPLLILLLINSGILNIEKISYFGFTIAKLPVFRSGELSISNIFKNLLDLNYYKTILFDDLNYNSYSEISSIYYFNIPILFLGLFYSIKSLLKKFEFDNNFIILILFLTSLFTSLLIDNNNINKINLIFFPIIYYIILGYIIILKNSKTCLLIVIITLFTSSSLFLVKYYNDYDEKYLFQYDFINVVKEVQYMNNDLSKPIIIDDIIDYDVLESYIYFLIYYDINPNDYIDKSTEFSNTMISSNANIFYLNYIGDYFKNAIYVTYYRSDLWHDLYNDGYNSVDIGEFSIFNIE